MGFQIELLLRAENDALIIENQKLREQVEQQAAQIAELLKAVADHVTVRCEQAAQLEVAREALVNSRTCLESANEWRPAPSLGGIMNDADKKLVETLKIAAPCFPFGVAEAAVELILRLDARIREGVK